MTNDVDRLSSNCLPSASQILTSNSAHNVPSEPRGISRRRFLDAALLAAAAAWLIPCPRLTAYDGIVGVIKNAAATGAITGLPLPGNASFTLASGGSIAVLSRPDGKLLVAAGIAGSQ